MSNEYEKAVEESDPIITSLSSELTHSDAAKLVSILLPAVEKCRELLADNNLQDQQFVHYIVGSAAMAAAKLLQQKNND
jgi:hypothetical protein